MIDVKIARYIVLRDLRDKCKAILAERVKPLNEEMKTIEIDCLRHLQEIGGDSIKTPEGTAYKSTRASAKVDDFEAFAAFVNREQLFHFFEKRASKEAVMDYIESTGDTPPGVSINSELTVNIRRS